MSLNPRIVDTDSDGTPFVGTIHNNAWLQALLDLLDARWSRVTITATGTQNNLSIADSGGHDADFVIFNNATDLTITGIAAPSSPAKPGKPLRYICTGAGNVFFKHQNAGSTAANRLINIATSGDTPHSGGSGKGTLVYDDSASRWQLLYHEQGAWITPTGPTYTPNVAGTFTPTSTQNLRYLLRGRVLLVSLTVTGTNSNASNTAIALNNTGWGGFTTPGTMTTSILVIDSGSGSQQSGIAQVAAGGTTLSMAKYNSATFTTGAGAISFFVTATLEVQ